MITNNTNNHIKFVSYTGKYPNLCTGNLTLSINGENIDFGYQNCDYEPFWVSGGSCGFTDNYSSSYINESKWIIEVEELPDAYKPYADEIDEVFNDNVPWGCCGGCL